MWERQGTGWPVWVKHLPPVFATQTRDGEWEAAGRQANKAWACEGGQGEGEEALEEGLLG